MKLFYYRSHRGMPNFGDVLNPWLWDRLLPNYFDNDDRAVFVGFGTLLNNLLPRRVPKAQKFNIFSTGVGYGNSIPPIDENWTIYCLRGPHSAQKLGVDSNLAVTDGAVLVRRFYRSEAPKLYPFSFMPHINHAIAADTVWQSICERIGLMYIDPRGSIEEVLNAISQTDILLTEALHGAIVADALRVPWIPLRTNSKILQFKWQDWCASMELAYQPQYVLPLWSCYPRAPGIRSPIYHYLKSLFQDRLRSLPHLLDSEIQFGAAQLHRIARNVHPQLSRDSRLEQVTAQLEERLDRFKQDCPSFVTP